MTAFLRPYRAGTGIANLGGEKSKGNLVEPSEESLNSIFATMADWEAELKHLSPDELQLLLDNPEEPTP